MYEELNEICNLFFNKKISNGDFISKIKTFCRSKEINDIRLSPELADSYLIKITFDFYPRIEIGDKNNNLYIIDLYGGFDLGSNDLYLRVMNKYGNTKIEMVRKLNNGKFLCDNLSFRSEKEELEFSSQIKNSKYELYDLHTIKYFVGDENNRRQILQKSFKINYNDLNERSEIFVPNLFSRVFCQEKNNKVYYFKNYDGIKLQGIFIEGDKICISDYIFNFNTRLIENDYDINNSESSIILSAIVDEIVYTLEINLGIDSDKIKYSIAGDNYFYYEGRENLEDIFDAFKNRFNDPFIEQCVKELSIMKDILNNNDLFYNSILSPSCYASNKERFISLEESDNLFGLIKDEVETDNKNCKYLLRNIK